MILLPELSYTLNMDDKYIRGIKIDWTQIEPDSYLKSIPAICNTTELEFKKNVTIFAGENGAGKSTLLEAMAISWGFNPEGGTNNFLFSTRDTHSELHKALMLIKGVQLPQNNFFLRAESFYNVASQVEDYGLNHYYGEKSLHAQSHGESFLQLTQTIFAKRGLYLLDEAESALSPQNQLSLLLSIYEQAKMGSQFFIITHSPILLAIPNAEILLFNSHGITPITYEETESFQIMDLFINHREQILRQLLS